MKFKDFIIPFSFFLFATVIVGLGAMFKILHWELNLGVALNGGVILTIGRAMQVVSILGAVLVWVIKKTKSW